MDWIFSYELKKFRYWILKYDSVLIQLAVPSVKAITVYRSLYFITTGYNIHCLYYFIINRVPDQFHIAVKTHLLKNTSPESADRIIAQSLFF